MSKALNLPNPLDVFLTGELARPRSFIQSKSTSVPDLSLIKPQVPLSKEQYLGVSPTDDNILTTKWHQEYISINLSLFQPISNPSSPDKSEQAVFHFLCHQNRRRPVTKAHTLRKPFLTQATCTRLEM